MKPLRIIASTALTLAALCARADAEWLSQTHDFGAFDENVGTVYCTFRLVNHGPDSIAIFAARANCGCTTPEYSPEPVAPGDTATVRVGFDPTGRPGRFVKHVSIDASDEPKRSSLTIQGTVIGAQNTLRSRYPIAVGKVKLRSSAIPYGKVWKGHSTSQYLECYNASPDTVRPYVSGLPEWLAARVQPEAVPPGEQFVVSTVMHTGSIPDWGAVTGSFAFHPDSGASEVQPVEVVAIVAEDFSKLTPSERENAPLLDTDLTAIDLERISPSSSPLRRTLTLTNRGKSPLVIRKYSCSDPAVSLSMKRLTIKPGKSEKMDVTVNPALIANPDLLNARIIIIANDPDHPSTTVRVAAEMIK